MTFASKPDRGHIQRNLEQGLHVLNLSAFTLAGIQAARDLQISFPPGPDDDHQAEWARLVQTLCGFDLKPVLAELNPPLLRSSPIAIDADRLVESARFIIESCPIGRLRLLARNEGLHALEHELQTAHARAKAGLIRLTGCESPRLALSGRLYSEGHLTAQGVAALLDVPVQDALALLETHGYSRSVEAIRLSDEDRVASLARLREVRVRGRARDAAAETEFIARQVIASNRIEGIDSRSTTSRWITPIQ